MVAGVIWNLIFLLCISMRTFEVTVLSIVKFLMTCLVSEALKDKEEQRRAKKDNETSLLPSQIFKHIHDVTSKEKIFLHEAMIKHVQY